jgi:hypothetical protein
MHGPGLLVSALKNDGVMQIFGLPGEESGAMVEARLCRPGEDPALVACRCPAQCIECALHRKLRHGLPTRIAHLALAATPANCLAAACAQPGRRGGRIGQGVAVEHSGRGHLHGKRRRGGSHRFCEFAGCAR